MSKVALSSWNQVLRPYQQEAVDKALAVQQGGTLLLAFPTGTGKGTIQIALLRALRSAGKNAWIVTPSIEVMRGYLERCGASRKELLSGTTRLSALGRKIFVTTPVRLRNALKSKRCEAPDVLIVDEAHHATIDTVAGGGLRTLTPKATWLGFTATPFRGSPEETATLQVTWGLPHVGMTIPQAIANGSWALPEWRVAPIVDDDTLGVKNGEFDDDEVSLETVDPLAKLVSSLNLDIPTCVTVSNVKAAEALTTALIETHSIEAQLVLGKTPTGDRAKAYERVKAGGSVLVSVRVLGEGVDFPWLDRWVDASPTASPVAFLQKLGRITRPGRTKYYVGVNRNLERHGYLLQGSVPRAEIKKAQEAFGGASTRGARAGMMKGVGKIKPVELPLSGGVKGTMWAMWFPGKNGQGMERVIMLDPTNDKAISATRTVDKRQEAKDKRWGPWTLEAEVPAKVRGFRASKMGSKPCSGPQLKWWEKSAENYGLDATEHPSRAQFFALPVLDKLGLSLRENGMTIKAEMKDNVAADDAPDLTNEPNLPDGHYVAIRDGVEIQYRLKTQHEGHNFAPGRQIISRAEPSGWFIGAGFVDGAKVRTWARYAVTDPREVQEDFALIRLDVVAAGRLFARKTGNCWNCNRPLDNAVSVARGIGPICAEKLGLVFESAEDPEAIDEAVNQPTAPNLESAQIEEVTSWTRLSNIKLAERMLELGMEYSYIREVFTDRYKAKGKTDLDWIRARVDTYVNIAETNRREAKWARERAGNDNSQGGA